MIYHIIQYFPQITYAILPLHRLGKLSALEEILFRRTTTPETTNHAAGQLHQDLPSSTFSYSVFCFHRIRKQNSLQTLLRIEHFSAWQTALKMHCTRGDIFLKLHDPLYITFCHISFCTAYTWLLWWLSYHKNLDDFPWLVTKFYKPV